MNPTPATPTDSSSNSDDIGGGMKDANIRHDCEEKLSRQSLPMNPTPANPTGSDSNRDDISGRRQDADTRNDCEEQVSRPSLPLNRMPANPTDYHSDSNSDDIGGGRQDADVRNDFEEQILPVALHPVLGVFCSIEDEEELDRETLPEYEPSSTHNTDEEITPEIILEIIETPAHESSSTQIGSKKSEPIQATNKYYLGRWLACIFTCGCVHKKPQPQADYTVVGNDVFVGSAGLVDANTTAVKCETSQIQSPRPSSLENDHTPEEVGESDGVLASVNETSVTNDHIGPDSPAHLRSSREDDIWGGNVRFPWGSAALHPSQWSTDSTPWMVRGVSYQQDSVKIPAGPPRFTLRCCDLISAPDPRELHHILSRDTSRLRHFRASGDKSFVLAINILCPSTPPTCFITYFTLDDAKSFFSPNSNIGRLARRFFSPGKAGDAFRSERFKLIPRIVKGPWIVRKAVGVKPALVGTKLTQSYFFGDDYLEILVDVSSSAIATATVGLCIEYAKELIVDMAFVIQGNDVSELPEGVLGGVRWNQASFSSAKPISSCISG